MSINQAGDGASEAGQTGSRFFGIERGSSYVRRLTLYFREGRILSIPYAHLPIFIYDSSRVLTIRTNDLDIVITGRSLDVLVDYLNTEKVTWIKESPSGIDDEDSAVFIDSIVASGDLLE